MGTPIISTRKNRWPFAAWAPRAARRPFQVPPSSTEDKASPQPLRTVDETVRAALGQCHVLRQDVPHSFFFCVVFCLYGVLSF